MPPLSRISVAALARLADQLRFAPREALLRDLERVESLAAEIDPEGSYPEEWIVYRVTGFRPDVAGPANVQGGALLTDLSALAERLSDAAGLTLAELDGDVLTIDELMTLWNVSRKTIERLRRSGLVARRARGDDGKWRLAFARATVERFGRTHAATVGRAAGFSRMDGAQRGRVVRRATLYRRVGLSLNEAAARIARRYGRSHEAIRQQLIRHDREASERGEAPLFGWRGPAGSSEGERALEAAARGEEPRGVAREDRRSAASVRRAMNLVRAARLRGLGLPAGKQAGVEIALSGGVLDVPAAREGLGESGVTDLLEFIRAARKREVPLGVVERARAEAYRELLRRAGTWIADLDGASPSASAIDAIETALRWASRLKVELVRSQLALAIETVEERVGRKLDELRGPAAMELAELALAAAGRGVEAHEPGKGGRLAAPVGLIAAREASRWMKERGGMVSDEREGRASGRLAPGLAFEDWTRRVAPWQAWLECDARVRGNLGRVGQDAARAIGLRQGWREAGGERPRTCAEVGAMMGVSATMAARLERRAIREALGM